MNAREWVIVLPFGNDGASEQAARDILEKLEQQGLAGRVQKRLYEMDER